MLLTEIHSSNGLDIIDLDNPLNHPRHLSHRMTGLVSDVQWSPFAVRDYWVASTANQKALVWNLNLPESNSQGPIEHTLSGHSRAITDINFSAHHPDMLATCAVDGYVHCWDLRRPRKPVLTFCDWFAGATQVKYNRQDSHILASSHDRWLRIWDDRKGAAPLRSINAHESKIYGVDWNRTRATGVVTCSLDKSIKFWDYENDLDEPERIIRTDFPVWRARHTPFGWGVLAMPQDTPGNLHLYERRLQGGMDKDCHAPAVTTFLGHGDHKVKEFLWRPRGEITDDGIDNREFQLVTWGEDNCLRLHHVDSDSLAGVGHIKGSQVRKKLNVTRKGAVYKTFRSVENKSSDKKLPTISGPRPGSSGLRASALTIGPKRMNLSSISHSGIMRAPVMKGKNRSSKYDDQSQPQIEWMSGIKILKHDNQTATRRSTSRRLSLLNPDFDEDWDVPESLHDEIIRIHEQLPKITFDDVNMDTRTVVASMDGPWGVDGAPIHITVTIVFPEQYPEAKTPVFTLGKSSLLHEDIYGKLKKEVQQIASGFVARKQGCLEATLCYLLGEVDLESSTTFYNDFPGLDDEDMLADMSSSDDEDNSAPINTSIVMSQELDSSAAESMLTPSNRNANVPLPRLCGARFAADGKLACFFPPKEDKVKVLIETYHTKNNARLKGEPMFESFHRLRNNNSPIPRLKTMSTTSESRTDSDASDISDYSSSSDADSTRFPARFQMSAYFRKDRRPYRKNSPTLLSQRSSAGGTGTGTTGIGRFRPSKPKNIVALYDIAPLLPSKIELAEDYAIFGDGVDVCQHNARAAEKHGYNGIADVWRYAALLLNNEVPLEVLNQTHRNEPIFIIAKDMLRRKRSSSGSDSGLDVTFDLHGRSQPLSGRVKWGTSPLAKQLIGELFAHFEATADIQMLAMLSCVFNEPIAEDAAMQADIPMTQPQTPITMKAPAFSLDYFPTDAAAWNSYRKTPISSVVSTPKFPQTPTGYYGSVGSSNAGVWGSDPIATCFSAGDTPPLRSGNTSNEHLNRQTQSLSTSPDNSRSFRRANSGLASSFAANFSRPFSMNSSSPPNPMNRKRPSPVENIINSLAPSAGITWGNTTVLGSVKEHTPIERSSYSDDEGAQNIFNPTFCTGITLSMHNQHSFDDEGCMSTPLLEISHAMLYASYRRAYAELLYLWGHPLSRLEILKFNGLTDYFFGWDDADTKSFAASIKSNETHDTAREDAPPSPILIGRNRPPPVVQSEQGLDVAGFCLVHETRLERHVSDGSGGGAVGRCDRCQVIQRQLRCVICSEPVSALFSPCLSCGCVSHGHCLENYHNDEETSCPGGCDCDCAKLASTGLVETWEVMMGAIESMRALEEKNGVKATEESIDEWDEKTDWEHMSPPPVGELVKPYNSLSRRLGQVRSGVGEWGMSGAKKKPSSLKNQEMF